MTDPTADMLTRIRNAQSLRKAEVKMPSSTTIRAIAQVLKDSGYIEDFAVEATLPQATIKLTLKYIGKTPVITKIDRVSKPGRRIYSKSKHISRTLSGYGISIISTSQGIMTDKEGRKKGLGGEVMCKVW